MENGEIKKVLSSGFKRSKIQQFLQTQKKLMLIQNGTTLLFMLTKPHAMTIISSNRSIWVNGNVACASLNFLILPITRSTWICTLESRLDESTSSSESCSFPFVKLGILRFASKALTSSFALKPRSASIQPTVETLMKKPDSLGICLSDTLPHHPNDEELIAPAGLIPIKYFDILLSL